MTVWWWLYSSGNSDQSLTLHGSDGIGGEQGMESGSKECRIGDKREIVAFAPDKYSLGTGDGGGEKR
jgi:hypothetical protein